MDMQHYPHKWNEEERETFADYRIFLKVLPRSDYKEAAALYKALFTEMLNDREWYDTYFAYKVQYHDRNLDRDTSGLMQFAALKCGHNIIDCEINGEPYIDSMYVQRLLLRSTKRLPTVNLEEIWTPIIEYSPDIVTFTAKDQGKESESESDDESSECEYLAQMEDHTLREPYQSENHISMLRREELLLGGMPQRKQRGKPKQRAMRPNPEKELTMRIPNHRRYAYLPPFMKVRMVYQNEETLLAAGSATQASPSKINSFFDVDGNFGSTSFPAGTALGTIYTRTLVTGGRITFQAYNNQSFSNGVGYLFTNTTPGTSGSGLYIKSGDLSAGFKRGDFKLLTPTGTTTANHTFAADFSVAKIVGANRVYTDDNFSAIIGSDPADLVWFTLFIDAGSLGNQTVGIRYRLKIELDVLFTQRASLNS